TIAALVLAEEAKDPYVRGHSKMVARYSSAIAKEMGFSNTRQRIMERASILHDLGKLGIKDSILNKPMKLDEEESMLMRNHPQRGVEMLKPLRFLAREQKIILHHHERYDGEGYPDCLKGDDIPMESRIIAVADTFDAMNSERPYRKTLPQDTIVRELEKVAGTQLDPAVVTIFLRLLKYNPSFWERN
ncbi:HD-GYP domain-containing protein, partial [Thermoproteota archaeon]